MHGYSTRSGGVSPAKACTRSRTQGVSYNFADRSLRVHPQPIALTPLPHIISTRELVPVLKHGCCSQLINSHIINELWHEKRHANALSPLLFSPFCISTFPSGKLPVPCLPFILFPALRHISLPSCSCGSIPASLITLMRDHFGLSSTAQAEATAFQLNRHAVQWVDRMLTHRQLRQASVGTRMNPAAAGTRHPTPHGHRPRNPG